MIPTLFTQRQNLDPQRFCKLLEGVSIMTKTFFWVLSAITILFFVSPDSAHAQNKLVVIPLGGGDVNKPDLVPLRVWRGSVNSDGAKRSQGRFTPSRQATGRYTVSVDLDIPGLDTSDSSIIGFGVPVVSINFGSAGDTIRVSGASKSTTAGQVTAINFNVATYNAANVLTDKNFHFHFMLNESNGPSAASSSKTSLLTELYPDIKCTTKGDTQTCVAGDAR